MGQERQLAAGTVVQLSRVVAITAGSCHSAAEPGSAAEQTVDSHRGR